ncbi:PH and SEC7 domain-containing protein 4-like [Gigantopelta aegis]|uniref:PH and SEC7 domain-containing protein 4-like n=1 Tax=Gigantopelta aegis TaxID=1735272 RepID=UPI001B888DB3|nr:PH and SEC7 domain-containing protein 4-like [Gigantopelta aegis]
MASRTSPSRIPIPVRSPPQSVKTSRIPVRSPQIQVRKPAPPPSNGQVTKKELTEHTHKKHAEANLQSCHENGLIIDTTPKGESPQRQKGKGFETFLMTGDMIIRTTPPHQKSPRTDSSKSPSLKNDTEDLFGGNYDNACLQNVSPSKIHSTKSHPAPMPPPPVSRSISEIVKAPVATIEDLSDMSQSESSSCSEALVVSVSDKFVDTPIIESCSLHKEPMHMSKSQTDDSRGDQIDGVVLTLNGGYEKHLHDLPSSGDSGVQQDSQSSDSDEDATKYSSLPEVTNSDDAPLPVMTSSQSEEKIAGAQKQTQSVVRTSKSHENYLESETGLALVNIDIDDDISYSLDTLACSANSPAASVEQVSEPTSRSLHSTPERREEKSNERVFMPGFISLEEPKVLKDTSRIQNNVPSVNSVSEKLCPTVQANTLSNHNNHAVEELESMESSDLLNSSDLDISDISSLYHQPMKSVDRPSAARLAKRLYHMDGFKKGDISRHLSKKNDFSTLVAEEYFKYFEIKGDTLDMALRRFLKQCNLSGETQERERVLSHFSRFYMECNPNTFNSEDACHTLTCAIMLLNTDLHGQFVGRKMTCAEFVENLAGLNDDRDFPKEVLKAIYHAIKAEPLEWATDDEPQEKEALTDLPGPAITAVPQHFIGSNPFLDLPDPLKTTEYKKGYVMRKCCLDADGRRTPLGRRSWKMFCAVLRDMILYLYKDEQQLKKGTFVENVNNAVRIHHSLATKATDYTKKQHVFRLQTSYYAEFLFQTSDSKELQEWIDTINMVAATYSAPALAGAVGSKVKKFQRPLFPASYTRLNMKDQLQNHEERVAVVELELQQHRSTTPEKGAKSRVIAEYLEKESFLEYEIKRFKTYVYLLQGKMMAYPELEPSLVETTIGEDEEVVTGPPTAAPPTATPPTAGYSPWKPVQRSLSDRPIGSDMEYESDIHVNKISADTYL